MTRHHRGFNSFLRFNYYYDLVIQLTLKQPISNCFTFLFQFIYGDKFEADFSGALDLLRLAHKYKVEPLTTKCKEKLMTGLQFEDALEVFQTANSLGNLDDLKQSAGNVLAKSVTYIFPQRSLL